MKKALTFSVIVSLCLFANAVGISVETARQTAGQFLTKKARLTAQAVTDQKLNLAYTAKQDGEACYYVFNTAGNGFIVTSADDVAEEVLMYADHGTFDINAINPNLRWWLDQYQRQIEFAKKQGLTATTTQQAEPSTTKVEVPILVKTRWDQGVPYNNEVYNQSKKRYPTGCVATTMSQLMKYHEWPITGIGSKTYTDVGYSGRTYTADFGNHTYDWANMKNTYTSSSYTTEEAKAVAQLMYDAGVSVEMEYATDGSGAWSEYVSYALVNFFGYDAGVKHLFRDYYTDSEWEEILYAELAAGRPVAYGGADKDGGGHSFICDGYKPSLNKFHFNWGWGGSGDAYCALSAVKVSGYQFDYWQDIVCGIQKPVEGSRCLPSIIMDENSSLKFTTTEKEDTATYNVSFGSYGSIYNDSYKDFDIVFTMKYTNQKNGDTYYAKFVDGTTPEKVTFQKIYGNITDESFYITSLKVKDVIVPKLPAGTYHVTLAYKEYCDLENDNDSLWREVPAFGKNKNYQELVVESRMKIPTIKEATDITDKGFTANWEETEDAESYDIELITKEKDSDNSEMLLEEDFSGFASYTADGTKDISSNLDQYMNMDGWNGSKVYTAPSSVKLGSSTAGASLISPKLHAEGKVIVTIGERKYNTDKTNVTLKIGDDAQYTFQSSGSEHEFETEINGDFQVKLFTSGSKQRLYINKVQVATQKVVIKKDTICDITDNKCIFSALSNTYNYSYRVRARNMDDMSKWSDFTDVTLSATPSRIVTFADGGSLTITREGNTLIVGGIKDASAVTAYTPDGRIIAQGMVHNGSANIPTNVKGVILLRIGDKMIKVRQ